MLLSMFWKSSDCCKMNRGLSNDPPPWQNTATVQTGQSLQYNKDFEKGGMLREKKWKCENRLIAFTSSVSMLAAAGAAFFFVFSALPPLDVALLPSLGGRYWPMTVTEHQLDIITVGALLLSTFLYETTLQVRRLAAQ
jgi:hypothetical protein